MKSLKNLICSVFQCLHNLNILLRLIMLVSYFKIIISHPIVIIFHLVLFKHIFIFITNSMLLKLWKYVKSHATHYLLQLISLQVPI